MLQRRTFWTCRRWARWWRAFRTPVPVAAFTGSSLSPLFIATGFTACPILPLRGIHSTHVVHAMSRLAVIASATDSTHAGIRAWWRRTARWRFQGGQRCRRHLLFLVTSGRGRLTADYHKRNVCIRPSCRSVVGRYRAGGDGRNWWQAYRTVVRLLTFGWTGIF